MVSDLTLLGVKSVGERGRPPFNCKHAGSRGKGRVWMMGEAMCVRIKICPGLILLLFRRLAPGRLLLLHTRIAALIRSQRTGVCCVDYGRQTAQTAGEPQEHPYTNSDIV